MSRRVRYFIHQGCCTSLIQTFPPPARGLTATREAALVKLTTLVEKRILQVGDILAYRRSFSTLGVTVEKDAIVSHLHSIQRYAYSTPVS